MSDSNGVPLPPQAETCEQSEHRYRLLIGAFSAWICCWMTCLFVSWPRRVAKDAATLFVIREAGRFSKKFPLLWLLRAAIAVLIKCFKTTSLLTFVLGLSISSFSETLSLSSAIGRVLGISADAAPAAWSDSPSSVSSIIYQINRGDWMTESDRFLTWLLMLSMIFAFDPSLWWTLRMCRRITQRWYDWSEHSEQEKALTEGTADVSWSAEDFVAVIGSPWVEGLSISTIKFNRSSTSAACLFRMWRSMIHRWGARRSQRTHLYTRDPTGSVVERERLPLVVDVS